MTILDRVRGLVERLSPESICDDCIAEKLELGRPQHADQQSRELAGLTGFERRKAMCVLCGDTKIVVRRR